MDWWTYWLSVWLIHETHQITIASPCHSSNFLRSVSLANANIYCAIHSILFSFYCWNSPPPLFCCSIWSERYLKPAQRRMGNTRWIDFRRGASSPFPFAVQILSGTVHILYIASSKIRRPIFHLSIELHPQCKKVQKRPRTSGRWKTSGHQLITYGKTRAFR